MNVGGPGSATRPEVQDAVLAHYLSRPDVIRQRAQHAAAIAGAAAAALVAAGGIAELYRYPKPIEGLLVLAILAWICTVAAYMHVVARHVDPVAPLTPTGELRADLLRRFEQNAADVRASLRLAQRVGQGALALTFLAIASMISRHRSSSSKCAIPAADAVPARSRCACPPTAS
jgi:hypothetical protein